MCSVLCSKCTYQNTNICKSLPRILKEISGYQVDIFIAQPLFSGSDYDPVTKGNRLALL